jgi:hypothetical protein
MDYRVELICVWLYQFSSIAAAAGIVDTLLLELRSSAFTADACMDVCVFAVRVRGH